MANHINRPISSYSDGDLLALAKAMFGWLEDFWGCHRGVSEASNIAEVTLA